MRVSIRISGRGLAEQEKELATFLGAQETLRGRVHLIAERRPTSGMSQSVTSIVMDLLGPAALVFASALIAWIRHRTADTRVVVRRADGTEFEISAQRVRGLSATELKALTEHIANAVADSDNPPRSRPDDPSALPLDGTPPLESSQPAETP
ncbi:hypothetical protein [Acrocarpospora sp. B8E8]|uniref:effector-associated constant component EACC1 n=1 Tax=Acrocarpospora sp. B8E8 TaxID=3153572 RepID=UPI00325F736A